MQTSQTLALTTQHDAFTLDAVTPDQIFYEAGDTITVDFDTSDTGLMLDVDFSAIDSGYTANAESVTHLGSGLYRVTYTLSNTNTRPSGDHRVRYELNDGAGTTMTGDLPLRYLPEGPMRHAIGGGMYAPHPPPSWVVDGSVTIVSITDTNVDAVPDAFDETYPSFSNGSPPKVREGRIFELEIQTDARDERELTAIVEDPARSGHVLVPLTPTSVTCTTTQCDYTAELVIGTKTPSVSQSAISLDISVVNFWDGVGTLPDDVQAPAHTPTVVSYLVKGHMTYDATPLVPNCTGALQEPFKCKVKQPTVPSVPAGMPVRLVTGCNETKVAWVDEEGNFELPFSSACGNDHAELKISSWAEPTPYQVAVADRAPNVTATFVNWDDWEAKISSNPNDYRTYNEWLVVNQGLQPTKFIPANDATLSAPLTITTKVQSELVANAIHIAKVGRRVQHYYTPWLGDDMHQFNILLDLEEVMPNNTSNFYPFVHAGFTHIFAGHRWSEFAVAHEYGHYLHYHFGRDRSDYYGRFSEPMAHVHAASVLESEWLTYTPAVLTENMDFNGVKSENGTLSQAQMNFYPSMSDPDIPQNPTCTKTNGKWSHFCCDSDPQDGTEDPDDIKHACMMVESQGWYWRIFYDLADGTSTEQNSSEPEEFGEASFDVIDGDLDSTNPFDHVIMDVVLGYLGGYGVPVNLLYDDRGIPHGDIVDVLDGMMCRGHMTEIQADDLLIDVMSFEYDFMPPVGNCQ